MQEKCKMFGGYEFQEIEGDAHVGNMHASTRIGNVRENQEDAVLIMQHPDPVIDDFKMMVVADGMGGMSNGEVASSLIIKEMKAWFEKLDVDYYSYSKNLTEELRAAIQDVNRKMWKKNIDEYQESGSTIVVAVTCQNITIVANVGDSRAYIIENQGISQITDDDSPVYYLWKQGKIKEKDDIRFHKESNLITQFMGIDEEVVPQIAGVKRSIPVILCSDGVSDCLSDDEILSTAQVTDGNELAKALVMKALSTESKAREGLGAKYNKLIPAGKDNATVAYMW